MDKPPFPLPYFFSEPAFFLKEKALRTLILKAFSLCGWRDSNPHAFEGRGF